MSNPTARRGSDPISSTDRFSPPTFLTMPILWDSPLVAAVARELDDLLRGARLRAHRFHWESRELTLWFRRATLRWSLHPSAGWVLLLPPEETPPDARPLAARVAGVVAPPDERLLRLGLEKLRGTVREVEVVVELMTNQWNALLLEKGTIRHLLWTRRLEERTLSVGQTYSPPPSSTRRGIESPLMPEEWRALVASMAPDAGGSHLLEELAFTSSLNLRSLLADPAPGGTPGPSLVTGWELWSRLRDVSSPEPCLLEATSSPQPYPTPLVGFTCKRTESLLEAMQLASRGARTPSPGSEELARERLERALGRARRKVVGLERELAGGRGGDLLRDRANLILARLGQLPRGRERVILPGFDGAPVELELNPALSPRENAEALYQEAARMDRARDQLPGLIEDAHRRVAELEDLSARLAAGLITPADALRTAGVEEEPGPAAGAGPEERLPYRRFRSSGGLEIRVGRSSRDNDLLTFRFARPGDVWLHARDAAGAHVILRWNEEGSPPARDLEEAAILAALGSRARTSGVVAVDWTRRKHVRKPRRAPPGAVLPERVRTLFVEPDPGLPARLRRSRPE